MILIGILTGLLILGIYLSKKVNDNMELLGTILIMFSSIILFGLLISIPVNRMNCMSNNERYNSFKETLKVSREKGSLTEIERAAIQQNIVEWNQDIASIKYYNKYFDLWIPDEITKLEYIE